jgi:hypothetical protein
MKIRKIRKNQWIQHKKIPLGRMDNGRICYKKIPLINDVHVSDYLLISAMTRRGKSVVSRLIYWFIARYRQIIVIDHEGDDHLHSYFANSSSHNLPPGTNPEPVKNSVFFVYPDNDERFDIPKKDYEKRVIPNLYDYNIEELRSLGFSESSALHIHRVLREYDNPGSIRNLYYFFDKYPTSNKALAETRKYRDIIDTQIKKSIKTYLYKIRVNKSFDLREDTSLDIIPYLKEKKNIFLNFKGNKNLARIEVSKIMKQVLYYMKTHKKDIAPYFVIEEADDLIPRRIEDPKEREKIQPILNTLKGIIIKAPKHKIGLIITSATITGIPRKIVDNCYEYIFGELNETELKEAKRMTNDYVGNLITHLEFDRFTGLREFVYFNEHKMMMKFKPFTCPQRFHKEQ